MGRDGAAGVGGLQYELGLRDDRFGVVEEEAGERAVEGAGSKGGEGGKAGVDSAAQAGNLGFG